MKDKLKAKKNVAKRLKIARTILGLTQRQFAEKIQLADEAKIRNIENLRSTLNYQIAKEIEKVFNINYKWLLEGTGNMFVDGVSYVVDDDNNKDNDSDSEKIEVVVPLSSLGSTPESAASDSEIEDICEELKKIMRKEEDVLDLLRLIKDGCYTRLHIKNFVSKLKQIKNFL